MSRIASKLNTLGLISLVVLLTIFPHGYVKGGSEKEKDDKLVVSMPVLSQPTAERYTVVRMQGQENTCLSTFNINPVKSELYLQNTIAVQDPKEYIPQNAAPLNQTSLGCAPLSVTVNNQSKAVLKVEGLVERYALRNTSVAVVQYRENVAHSSTPMLSESKVSFALGYEERTVEIKYGKAQNWEPKAYIKGKSSQYEILLC